MSKIMIIVSKFNSEITSELLKGARRVLHDSNKISDEKIKELYVPGVFEIPVVAAKAADNGGWDAIICLGCVIKGETPHFDYICSSVSNALNSLAVDSKVPIIFGVLTTDSWEQAEERAGLKERLNSSLSAGNKRIFDNKGSEAACAALSMIEVIKSLKDE